MDCLLNLPQPFQGRSEMKSRKPNRSRSTMPCRTATLPPRAAAAWPRLIRRYTPPVRRRPGESDGTHRRRHAHGAGPNARPTWRRSGFPVRRPDRRRLSPAPPALGPGVAAGNLSDRGLPGTVRSWNAIRSAVSRIRNAPLLRPAGLRAGEMAVEQVGGQVGGGTLLGLRGHLQPRATSAERWRVTGILSPVVGCVIGLLSKVLGLRP